jgi:alkylated DNA repair dioxygenase AlkB
MDAEEPTQKKSKTSDIHGLQLVEDFLTAEEEEILLACIQNEAWNTSLSRRTQHYGYVYDYTTKEAAVKALPIPTWCEFVLDRLLETRALTHRPDQLIVNEYTCGQGIHPHVDSVSQFEDGIVSVSLASAITMDFISCNDAKNKHELHLPRRSALVLHKEARYKWRHGIATRKKDHGVKRGTRVSLTFRKMKK